MVPPTKSKTTPKPSKQNDIHPLTPSQTHEHSSLSSSTAPLRRRSLRLASVPNSEPTQPPAATTHHSSLRVSTVRKGKGKKTNPNGSEDERENGFLNLRSGKKVLKQVIMTTGDDDSGNSRKRKNEEEEENEVNNDEGGSSSSRRRKGKEIAVDNNRSEENAAFRVREHSRRSSNMGEQGSRRNEFMERFRNIARENASRFALFAHDENENEIENDEDHSPSSSPSAEEEKHEIEDWPGPFSTAMKIIRDREKTKGIIQTGSDSASSSQKSLFDSIAWVPKPSDSGKPRFSALSLQELCLQILVKNVDAIVSLESVPDSLRHRLSQLLCDSRRINDHFFELLVGGAPTEVRLRDCSWLTEEQFTKCFQACDTSNLVVLQLDQCGRCLADYVIVATLAQSPRQLPRLTSLSLSGACRLSDGGLRALVSSAPALRSMNLSQCSLLTSASLYILAESLKSLLKELYLDDCQGIDAGLIVPALMELEHLEVLSVAGIQTVCDEFVKDYIVARGHNMKELILKGCIYLTDASIKVIAEHCPELCVLDIMNLCKLTDLSIGYLTNGCRSLHTLKLSRNPFSDEAIAAFVETTGESLKELSLNNIKKVGYHTTVSLASHAKSLHSLDLSWCRNLTNNALGLIVDSCLSLRLLKLFGCTQVTDAFLNGHSNLQIQIVGLKMSPILQHVRGL